MDNQKQKQNKVFLVAISGLFLIALICGLAVGVVNLILLKTAQIKQIEYTINDFELVGIEPIDTHRMITQTDDPQMIMSAIKEPIKNIWLKAEFSYDPGEVVLFYTTKEGEAYSAKKMIYPRYTEGYYYFELPFAGIKSVRIDPGIFPSITVSVDQISFNRFTSPVQFFQLESVQILKFVLVATYLAFAISLGWGFFKRRKNKKEN